MESLPRQSTAPIGNSYGTRTVKRVRRTTDELSTIDDALIAIAAEQRPMTVRQVFYQATVRQLVPKDEAQGYRVVQRRLVSLRKSKRIPYGWITDNLRFVHGHTRYGGINEFAEEVSGLYRRDYWRGSDVQVQVWIEKDALASVISPIVIREWGLDLHVARGFSSISYLYEAAESIADDGRETFIYVLTDLDPSGIGIARDIESKLAAMVGDRAKLHAKRLAVDPWQVSDWKLPTRPTKQTDARAAKFQQQYGDVSVELDAIPPNTLRRIVGDAIASHADRQEIERMKAIELCERESIAKWQSAIGGIH